MQLQRYCLDVTYKKGRELILAYLVGSKGEIIEDDAEVLCLQSPFEMEVAQIRTVRCPYITTAKLQDIRRASAEDNTWKELQSVIHQGWPERKEQLNPLVLPYYQHRDRLVVEDGIVYHGNRCVIPPALRAYTLKRIHDSHMGIGGCIRRARVFFGQG